MFHLHVRIVRSEAECVCVCACVHARLRARVCWRHLHSRAVGDYLVVLLASPQLLCEASGYFLSAAKFTHQPLKCRWLGAEKWTDFSEVVGILGI